MDMDKLIDLINILRKKKTQSSAYVLRFSLICCPVLSWPISSICLTNGFNGDKKFMYSYVHYIVRLQQCRWVGKSSEYRYSVVTLVTP